MSEPRVSRRPPLLVALATFLFLECALLAAATTYLVIELLIAVPASYATAIAVLILVLLAAIWLAVMAVHALRGRYWIRGAAVTWQALQIAIGIGSFQGLFARPVVGWLLIIPAVIVIVLLFTPPVLEATKRAES